MNKNTFRFAALALCFAAALSCGEKDPGDQNPTVEEPKDTRPVYKVSAEVNPFTWIAIDGQGNTIDPDNSGYKDASKRTKKQVGIFYFLWHGCHGYDRGANYNEVHAPTASDTKSPYDIQKLLDANPTAPALGGGHVMHHWGEPYLGYYVMNDEWVIRKHAQMLSDAGVDVIFFDVTNGYHYLPVVKQLCEVYTKMREEGNKTPQFAFLINANAENVLNACYEQIYSQNLYKDLWYEWIGKPLVLANPDAISGSYKEQFQFRQSWYLWNNAGVDTWFADGVDKWPWGGLYPQQPGLHNGKNECVSVMPATHPTSNIGRSSNTSNVEPKNPQPGKGIYFKAQFDRAMKLDPTMMFVTGWNEWTAQKQISQNGGEGFLGKTVSAGDWYFVDQYNHEFSRDIEPLNGDFGDNYYYLLVDYIRKFKGTLQLPTFSTVNSIAIDGSFSDWKDVEALYGDNKGDVDHRNHYGWGSVGTYTNDTGRNDIVLSKVTNDGENICFYAATSSDITPYTDAQWMQLFIRVKGETAWEGFDFAVNRTKPSGSEAVLEKSQGGWKWSTVGKVKYKVAKNEIEIAIPLSSLGITDANKFTVDFKWIDNAAGDGDIQTCMRDGDSAPDGRFRYRYKFKKD